MLDKFLDFSARTVVRTMKAVSDFKESFKNDEGGFEIIQVVLILLCAVVLIGIFWDKISVWFGEIWDKITGTADPIGG